MMIFDLNVAVLYGRFLSYRGGLYNRFDCIIKKKCLPSVAPVNKSCFFTKCATNMHKSTVNPRLSPQS